MSKNYWAWADTHLFHEKLLKFEGGRPEFESVQQMHDCMLTLHNEVVKPGDRVYWLGDVACGNYGEQELGSLINKFKGSKKLILGNHDRVKLLAKHSWFAEIVFWNNLPEWNMVLSHMPLHPQTQGEKENRLLNVHGHIHRTPSPSPKHYCVCVEQTNYRPVNLEDLKAYIWKELK